jgi:hypothetical protein
MVVLQTYDERRFWKWDPWKDRRSNGDASRDVPGILVMTPKGRLLGSLSPGRVCLAPFLGTNP